MIGTTIQVHNERAAMVWSAGGERYDEISRGISDSIEHCVRRLNPQPGERILDLSTGTGWTSRVVARRGAMVTGVDIATDLLEAARARANAEGLPIDYRVGDAESLPFNTGEFDAVVSTFGVMFASRPEAAAAELARVCRLGGRIALTTWTPDGGVRKMFEVMKRYMPPPPSPAPRSPFEWGKTERIRELLGGTFDAPLRKRGVLLPRAERRGGLGDLLDRLRSDAGAGRQPRSRAAARAARRFHRVPCRLHDRAGYLRPTRLLPDHWRTGVMTPTVAAVFRRRS